MDGCAAVLVMFVVGMSQLTQYGFNSMLKNILQNANVVNRIETDSRVIYVFASASQCLTLYLLGSY